MLQTTVLIHTLLSSQIWSVVPRWLITPAAAAMGSKIEVCIEGSVEQATRPVPAYKAAVRPRLNIFLRYL